MKVDPKKAEAIGLLLAGLQTQFWQEDISVEQNAFKTIDFITDLAEFKIEEIQAAIQTYRRDPSRTKMPTSGQLRSLALKERADAIAAAQPKVRAEFPGRPMRWWLQSKNCWQPHWLESEVPRGEKIKDKFGAPLREPVR